MCLGWKDKRDVFFMGTSVNDSLVTVNAGRLSIVNVYNVLQCQLSYAYVIWVWEKTCKEMA